MKFLYGLAGMIVFVLILSFVLGGKQNPPDISNDAMWLSLAIVFAGGMAGGNK